jgi:hypothetical protein
LGRTSTRTNCYEQSECRRFLLVESTSGAARIPALCHVQCYWKESLPELSQALWDDNKFPYIFFFDTEQIDFTWTQFVHDLQYSENYDPRGLIQSVSAEKLIPLGGAEQYVQYVRQKYGQSNTTELSELTIEAALPDESPDYISKVKRNFTKLVEQSRNTTPRLTEGKGKVVRQTTVPPRSEAFRIGVAEIYDWKCAVCSLGLIAPNGKSAVESAHIYPRNLDGSEDLRNGICLCYLHHWAFDVGWFSISDDWMILTRPDIPTDLGYDFIRQFDGCTIRLPLHDEFRPAALYMKAHRQLHGFE